MTVEVVNQIGQFCESVAAVAVLANHQLRDPVCLFVDPHQFVEARLRLNRVELNFFILSRI